MTASAPPISSTAVGSSQIISPVPLHWVRGVQILWLIITVISLVVYAASVPVTYERYLQPCDGGSEAACLYGQISPAAMKDLAGSGVRADWVFGFFMLFMTAGRLLEVVLSGLLIWYGRQSFYVLFWGFIVLSCSMMVVDYRTALDDSHPLIWLFRIGGWFNILTLTIACIGFPDGRFNPRWSMYGAISFTLFAILYIALTGTVSAPSPGSRYYELFNIISGLQNVFLLVVLIYRYRRLFTQAQRQQTKWFIYTMVMGLGLFLLWDMTWSVLDSEGAQASNASYVLSTNFVSVILIGLSFVGFTIAILRYRLWDIDIIIQRTLVYGVLTTVVVGVYVLVVGTLSTIFQSGSSLLISLIATGVVAVLFQPLREQLQRAANRYIFGERNNPYAVIARLSERLEANVAPGTLLPGIAETVAQALKLPYVAIALKDDDYFKTDTVYGQPMDRGRITTIPLLYGQEVVGQMIIGQDAGDKQLNTSERQLLDNIARQTGIAAHAVQLTLALQHSRQQIVTAREEERRRLRRDLHDGIGPALAAHTIKVGAARLLLENDPQTAANFLIELENNLSNSLGDIRRLVYNLRPPALDQLGLIGALSDFVQQCSGKTVFSLNTPEMLSAFPAAVEVATYRIVQEAINNVMRHAQAQKCEIDIVSGDELVIRISDDGTGLPADVRFGVGLNGMRERAEELGGQFMVASTLPRGTQLEVILPYINPNE